MQTFVNLHHHDEFSMRDGLGNVGDLIKLNKSLGVPFACITNHGSVGGWVKQYNACRKSGVKAIFGMEAYYNDYRGDDPDEKKKNRKSYHLVLIAKTYEGFKNIIKIHNDAQLNGFYYYPRVNHDALKKWGKGIVATSACMSGELPNAIMEGDDDKAVEIYQRLNECFDEFYVEMTIIDMDEQAKLNKLIAEFAERMGAKTIVTLDSHYLYPEHKETHDLLMLVREHKTINDAMETPEEVWQFNVGGLYCRPEDDLRELFEKMHRGDAFTDEVFNQSIANTRAIAEGCDEIKLDDTLKLPKLYADAEQELRTRAHRGLISRELDGRKPYEDRLEQELEIICKMGFADYFLIVETIVSDAKNEFGEWATGFGRGSAAGALVSYALRITDIDPISYGLLFERFLDESRPDAPDIDLDFHPKVRDWVKDKIIERFGEANTCSIGTYSTYKTKSVIMDVSRTLGLDYMMINAITREMDGLQSFTNDDTGEDEKLDKMSFEDICEHFPKLKEFFDNNPIVLEHCKVMRGQVKNMGKHAGGVIISNLNLSDEIPVFRDKSGQIVSAWAEGLNTHELSAIGLVKFDILGLNNLAVIQDCINYIKKTKGRLIKRTRLPIDNQESIVTCSKADLVGIFQFEHPSTKPIADAIGMESLLDISAVTSLIRPGPRNKNMHLKYADRKRGKEDFESLDCLKSLLDETHGILVYQEQVQLISQVLAGFTPVESNMLRRVLIKEKDVKILEDLRVKFVEGCKPRIANGELTAEEADEWFRLMHSFAGYGFNKSVDKGTLVDIITHGQKPIEDVRIGDQVWAYEDGRVIPSLVVGVHDHGLLWGYEVGFSDGSRVVCSLNHKFQTQHGMKHLYELLGDDHACEEERRMDLWRVRRDFLNKKKAHSTQNEDGTQEAVFSKERYDDQIPLLLRRRLSSEAGFVASSQELSGGNQHCEHESQEGVLQEHRQSTRVGEDGGREEDFKRSPIEGRAQRIGEPGSSENQSQHAVSTEQDRTVQGEVIKDRRENICKERHTVATRRAVGAVAEGTSGGSTGYLGEGTTVCQERESRVEVVGDCVSEHGIQTQRTGSLLGDCETDRLREGEHLDRGGWLLALRHDIRKERSQGTLLENPRKRCNRKQSSRRKKDYADSSGSGVLSWKREAEDQRRMEGVSSDDDKESPTGSVVVRKIVSVRSVGIRHMFDLEIDHPSHAFKLSNGIITSNSHSVSYGAISAVELWLKYRFRTEYIAALINSADTSAKPGKKSDFARYVDYARKCGITVLSPSANGPIKRVDVVDGKIALPLVIIKGFGKKSAPAIKEHAPFTGLDDFFKRVPKNACNKKVVEGMISAGAFDEFEPSLKPWEARQQSMENFHNLRLADPKTRSAAKKVQPPKMMSRVMWENEEKTAIGICVSRRPLSVEYSNAILNNGWATISDLDSRKSSMLFGRITSVVATVSKRSGKNMKVVEITDDIDTTRFYVMEEGFNKFNKSGLKANMVAVVPVQRFGEDGGGLFFNTRKDTIVPTLT